MARVVGAARHPVDLSDGRSLGPGEIADDIDVEGDEHNRQLLASGRLVVLEDRPPTDAPTNPSPPVTTPTIDDATGGAEE